MKDHALSFSFSILSLLGHSSISYWLHKMSWEVHPHPFSERDYVILLLNLSVALSVKVSGLVFSFGDGL